tara:strand:+ start:281 stop:1693 length:1413 start_codon:yes stop_codon:yes gene_type:complete
MIVDNKSTELQNHGGTGMENNIPSANEMSNMKVKSELRPMMRKLVDVLQKEGLASRKDCSDYRYQIKMGSKSQIMDLANKLSELYGDALENLQPNQPTQKENRAQMQKEGSGIKFKPQGNEKSEGDDTSYGGRINNVEQKVDDLAEMIANGIMNIKPNEVKDNNGDELKHFQFDTIKLMLEENKQVLLVGDAGSGKTYLGKQLASALNCENFHSLSLTSGMSESHITGRMNIEGTFLTPEFMHIVENGGLILLDEFDNGDTDVLVGLNSLLANGFISCPLRTGNEMAIRHEDCYIVCSANTWGNANSGNMYVRKQLDGATLDRFVCSKVEVGNDRRITHRIMGLSGDNCEVQEYPELEMLSALERQNVDLHVGKLMEIFDTIKQYTLKPNMQIRQMCSNRAYEQGAKLVRRGITPNQVLKLYLQNWTDDELKRIGVERDKTNEFFGVISYNINEKEFFNGVKDTQGENNE